MIADLLLLADALVNLVIGAVLATYPASLIGALSLPASQSTFYPRLLGMVLIGIGIALLLNALPTGLPGLGLAGAIAINLSAAAMLVLMLLTGLGKIPRSGKRLLWIVALVLIGLSALEGLMI